MKAQELQIGQKLPWDRDYTVVKLAMAGIGDAESDTQLIEITIEDDETHSRQSVMRWPDEDVYR